MPRLRHLLAGTVAALTIAANAEAAIINGSDFTSGLATQTIGGLTWQAGPSGRTFERVTIGVPGFTGVGISGGRSPGEIDTDETLTASAATAFAINSITLGGQFNGPEFSDVRETAQITVNLGSLVFTLTTTLNDTTAVLSNPALGTVTNLGPATNTGGGAWRIDFARPITDVRSVSFTALPGPCGTGACTNQSDFTFVQMVTSTNPVTPPSPPTGVPEPGAIALFGAALLGLGALRRRRDGQGPAA